MPPPAPPPDVMDLTENPYQAVFGVQPELMGRQTVAPSEAVMVMVLEEHRCIFHSHWQWSHGVVSSEG